MRWLVCILVALVAVGPALAQPRPARSQEEEDARQRALEVFRQGKTAYKAGDYEAALAFFRRAQALYQHEPLIILALAKTLDRAGDGERALTYYRLFLREAGPEDPDRASTLARMRALEAELAARPGTVILRGLPSGAAVLVDGQPRGVDHRAAIELPAGTWRISVRMPNRMPFERQVVVKPGAELEIDVVLLEPVDPSTLPRDHRWTWVLGGLGGAALLTTGVLAVRAASLHTDYSELFDPDSGRATATGRARYDCPATATDDADCPGLIAEGRRLREAIDGNSTLLASFGIATGALAVGTVMAWLAAPIKASAAPPPAAKTSWSLVPRPGGALAGLTLRF